MNIFTKYIDTGPKSVRNEVELQRAAVKLNYAPRIIDTDYKTYISMYDIGEMNLADKYGDTIGKIPLHIRNRILDILWSLYSDAGIEYIDVTPYNFIEKNGVVWIIDFGHAKKAGDTMNPYLAKIFTSWKLVWNPKFK